MIFYHTFQQQKYMFMTMNEIPNEDLNLKFNIKEKML
jgi:hypothetical protein